MGASLDFTKPPISYHLQFGQSMWGEQRVCSSCKLRAFRLLHLAVRRRALNSSKCRKTLKPEAPKLDGSSLLAAWRCANFQVRSRARCTRIHKEQSIGVWSAGPRVLKHVKQQDNGLGFRVLA